MEMTLQNTPMIPITGSHEKNGGGISLRSVIVTHHCATLGLRLQMLFSYLGGLAAGAGLLPVA